MGQRGCGTTEKSAVTPLQIVATVVFWVSVILLVYNYIGLYLYLGLISRKKGETQSTSSEEDLPSVTVIIPAHNEEDIIAKRIQNILHQDYQPDRINVVVGSDCSDDQTVQIAREYSDCGVEVVEMPTRSGKLGVIDYLVQRASGEVVVITDSNVFFANSGIKELMKPYKDPRVGGVCGNLALVPPSEESNVERELNYREFETSLKNKMSRLGIVIGAYGGFYSLRRRLFKPLGKRPCHDDVILPLEILAQGYKVVFSDRARAVEATEPTIRGEFKRRVRMATYNFLTLPRAVRLSFRAGLHTGFITLSYKVIRWLGPFIWASAFVSSILLVSSHPFYLLTTALFILGVAIAIIAGVIDWLGRSAGPALAAYHFALMNIAGFIGLFNLLKGAERYWKPRG